MNVKPMLALALIALALVPSASAEPTPDGGPCDSSVEVNCTWYDDAGNQHVCGVWVHVNVPDWPLDDCVTS